MWFEHLTIQTKPSLKNSYRLQTMRIQSFTTLLLSAAHLGGTQAKLRTRRLEITVSELESHATDSDCWVQVNDNAYDVTAYAPTHPGGAATIHAVCGQDITAAYFADNLLAFHTDAALEVPTITNEGVVVADSGGGGGSPFILMSQFLTHSTDEDCWVKVNGIAYDVTDYAPTHPGGAASVYATCGQDITEAYFAPTLMAFHTGLALNAAIEIGLVIADEDKDNCFPGDATVQVKDKGPVFMKDLVLGDEVLTSNNVFETIYSFGHKNTDAIRDFVKLSTKAAYSIELSTDHMVYLKGGFIVPAGIVQLGDELEIADGTFSPVRTIKTVQKQGLFAPFTASGSVIVNGIKASTFVAFQESGTLHVAGMDTGVTFQFLAHTFELPHRIWCLQLSSCETTETYSDEGISTWVNTPNKVFNYLFHSNDAAVALVMAASFILMVAIVSKCTQVRLVGHLNKKKIA